MDFNLEQFMDMIMIAGPEQVNIGADSGGNNLPEPDREKLLLLIWALDVAMEVKCKPNLKRLLPDLECRPWVPTHNIRVELPGIETPLPGR